MENFCGKLIDNTQGNNCIPNHFTGKADVCSYYMHNGDAGGKCRAFLQALYDKPGNDVHETYDEVIRKHCDKHPQLDECKCRRRSDNTIYQDIIKYSQVQQGSPYCWWAPCRSGLTDGMFRETEIEQIARDNDCSNTICANVTTYVNSHQNVSDGAEQYVSCDLGSGSDTEGGGGQTNTGTNPSVGLGAGADGNQIGNTEEADYTSYFNDNVGKIMGIIGGVLLVIGVLFFFLRNQKNDGGEKVPEKNKAKTSTPASNPDKKIEIAGGKGIFGYLFSEEGSNKKNKKTKKQKNKKTKK